MKKNYGKKYDLNWERRYFQMRRIDWPRSWLLPGFLKTRNAIMVTMVQGTCNRMRFEKRAASSTFNDTEISRLDAKRERVACNATINGMILTATQRAEPTVLLPRKQERVSRRFLGETNRGIHTVLPPITLTPRGSNSDEQKRRRVRNQTVPMVPARVSSFSYHR